MRPSYVIRRACAAIAISIASAGLVNFPSYAGEQSGRITSLLVRASDGLISVELEGSHSGKPACATYNYWILKGEGTSTGKQQYAALLAAKLSGKTVRIQGGDQCTRWADGEDINSIYIVD